MSRHIVLAAQGSEGTKARNGDCSRGKGEGGGGGGDGGKDQNQKVLRKWVDESVVWRTG